MKERGYDMDLIAKYRLEKDREGGHDTLLFEVNGDKVTVKKYCETEYEDEFVEPRIEYETKINIDAISFLKKNLENSTGEDYELTVGGKTISGNYSDIPDYLLEFQKMSGIDIVVESEKTRINMMSIENIRRSYESGLIKRDRYESLINEIQQFNEEKKKVDSMIADGCYPFERKPSDMIFDVDNGLITTEQFNMFVWFKREGVSDKSSIVSIKLRLSLWGQRLIGRYDTCEYILDETELSERRYSVHGTLFEGCGNYKAPETAIVRKVEQSKIEKTFSFVQGLFNSGFLNKEYNVLGADNNFFDLYVKFKDGKNIHTKGTAEYPYFIKFLMYMMNVKDIQ